MKFFFIFSIGRTGTKFLANLLNTVDKAIVHHEPYPYDKQILFYGYSSEFKNIRNTLLTERFKKLLQQNNQINIYGEVNPYLRYESEWLRKNLGADIFVLSRDGKEYIRSAYSRNLLTPEDLQQTIVPKDNDLYSRKWHQMSRFERICWYYKTTYEYLTEIPNTTILKFDKLVDDYDYLKNNLLIPLKIEIPYEVWNAKRIRPLNSTKRFKIKKTVKKILIKNKKTKTHSEQIQNWTREMEFQFNAICGDIQKKLGY